MDTIANELEMDHRSSLANDPELQRNVYNHFSVDTFLF